MIHFITLTKNLKKNLEKFHWKFDNQILKIGGRAQSKIIGLSRFPCNLSKPPIRKGASLPSLQHSSPPMNPAAAPNILHFDAGSPCAIHRHCPQPTMLQAASHVLSLLQYFFHYFHKYSQFQSYFLKINHSTD